MHMNSLRTVGVIFAYSSSVFSTVSPEVVAARREISLFYRSQRVVESVAATARREGILSALTRQAMRVTG